MFSGLKNTFFIFTTLTVTAVTQPVHAQTLEEAILHTWKNSPEISAAEKLVSLTHTEKLRRFIPNNPQLTYSNTDNNTAQSYGANISLAFPGKALFMTHLDLAKEKMQKAAFISKRYDLASLVITNYLECSSTYLKIKLAQENAADLAALEQTLKARYESGVITQSEIMTVQLQISQQNLELAQLQEHAQTSCNKLAQITGLNTSMNISEEYTLPDDLSPHMISLLGHETGDEAKAKASMKLAEAQYKTAWWNTFPDLNFGVSRNHYSYLPGSPNGQELTTNYTASMTFPLFGFFHERVDVKRAKNEAIIQKGEARIQSIEAANDKEEAKNELILNIARLQQLRSHDLPLAEGLVESTLASYQSGKLGFAEVLLARKTLLDIKGQDIQLRNLIITSRFRSLYTENEKEHHT